MRALRLLLILWAAALQAGCGLPDSYFLQAPVATAQATDTSNSFQFSNPVHALTGTLDLNVTFNGNELYYRFYAATASINQNVYDPTSPSDPSTQLQNAGFLPVRSSSDQTNSPSTPLISIPGLAGTGSAVTVVLANGSSSTPSSFYSVSNGGPTNQEVRRNIPDTVNPLNVNHFKYFATNSNLTYTNYIVSDTDMAIDTSPGGVPTLISTGATVYVALYALSYGMSTSSTPVRSAPTYLGFMKITQF